MQQLLQDGKFFGTESVWRILYVITPPVVFTQLIQALYNIVDSFFVGHFSPDALTALSAIYPIQFMTIAFAVGTGTGVSTYMAKLYALGRTRKAGYTAGDGSLLAIAMWAVFALFAWLLLPGYARLTSSTPQVQDFSVIYGNIVCIGSLPLFLESIWTKVHQAGGDMRRPMEAQLAGSLTNIALDPLLIFGCCLLPGVEFPSLGVAGAAYATVIGQSVAAAVTFRGGFRGPSRVHVEVFPISKTIYRLGYPNILMQLLMTVYIVILNIILARFSDAAVTVLGLYYRLQTFFFIPLGAMMTCIVPVLSYNYALGDTNRCRKLMHISILIAATFMIIGTFCFVVLPGPLISVFSHESEVFDIGIPAFRTIGWCFVPAVFSLIYPVFFQAIGKAIPSVWLSVTRQIFCLIPIFYLLSLIGVHWVWLAFPLSESITGLVGILLYLRETNRWKQLRPHAIH